MTLMMILKRYKHLHIDLNLNAIHLDNPDKETDSFIDCVEPFILCSMVGILKHWCIQSGSLNFLHTNWFYQWGFGKVFLHAFEAALVRLPYNRFPHNVDKSNITPHIPPIPLTPYNLSLTMFWSLS